MAQQRHNNNSYRNQTKPRNNNQWASQSYQSSPQGSRSDSKGPRPYFGRCQICGVQGHSAKRCPQLNSFQTSSPNQNTPFTPWTPRANYTAAATYNPTNWIMDSGAIHHITSDLSNLSLHQPYHGGSEVMIADGSTVPIQQTGFSTLPTPTRPIALHNVLYVPHINKHLISVYRLCNSNGVSVEFFPSSFQVKDLKTGVRLLCGKAKAKLYEWPLSTPQVNAASAYPTSKTTLSSWHSRFGHPSYSILQNIVSSFTLPVSLPSQKQFSCNDCFINKSHKLPFSQSSITSTQPFQYLFSDIWTSPILSSDNYNYYLVIIDHFTRYSWPFPLKQKSQTKETIIAFKNLVENFFQTKIRTFYTDNGGEFIALRQFFQTHGISHYTSPPHTPEHNGIYERKHRHIVETGMSLFSKAFVLKRYWPLAFAVATYLINRMPTPNLELQSPFLKLFGKSPNYRKLHIFGCACYPWLKPYNRHKHQDRSIQCVFFGYSATQSAFLCYDRSNDRLFVSRHVQFDEHMFPYSDRNESPTSSKPTPDQTPFYPPVSPLQLAPQQRPPPSDPHRTAATTTTSPPSSLQPQVSSLNPQTPSVSSSSEPTAPIQNGPQPTVQTTPNTFNQIPAQTTHNPPIQPSPIMTQTENPEQRHNRLHTRLRPHHPLHQRNHRPKYLTLIPNLKIITLCLQEQKRVSPNQTQNTFMLHNYKPTNLNLAPFYKRCLMGNGDKQQLQNSMLMSETTPGI